MEKWLFYGLIAAILIAMRDIFTKKFSDKYSPIEHLLYYYILCGFFIILLAIYKIKVKKEKIKMIDSKDIWLYLLVAGVSAIIISPCQVLSLKTCDNPGKSKAIVNLNSLFAFFFALFFIKGIRLDIKSLFGILLASFGVYLTI